VPVLARVALLIVAVATAAWLASAYPGARDEARARDLPTRPDGSLAPRERDRAIDLLEAARRRRPDSIVVPQLAAHYLARGDRGRAIALLRQRVRTEPKNVTGWPVLALALAGNDPAGARAANVHRRNLAPPVPR
jgi:cytochrome c-type biogenesis protein CcmH/NrfG